MPRQTEEYLQRLREVILKNHGFTSEHMATVYVADVFDGRISWAGEVEVFAVDGCPKAKVCYAWSHKNKKLGMDSETVQAVLHSPPVIDVKSAVQTGIDAEEWLRKGILEIEAAKTKPWTARRLGEDVFIAGFRPFPVKNLVWHMERDETHTSPDSIGFRFWGDLPQDFELPPQQTWHKIFHTASGIAPAIVRVQIIEVTGKPHVIPIE